MKKPIITSILITASLLATLPVHAQQKRLSPHETVSAVVDGNRVTIVYGRPHTIKPGTSEVRQIWGGLVPYGKIWRLGADEATLLITQKPIEIGGTTVPAGAYTLFMLPQENEPSKLVINKQLGQWGLQYNEGQDLARVDLKKQTVDEPVAQFTMAIQKEPSGGGLLKLTWEKTEFSVTFSVQK
ncbi:MAG: DUF2911 domain-containing protein [Limisphaerales bacterium]